MDTLIRKIESQLAGLPVPVAVQLPAGKRVGPPTAAVTLSFKDWSSLATMAAGQIGRMAEDFVESRVQLEGRMRDLMAVAARLLPGSPVNSDTGWWTQMLRRAKSVATHSPHKDAQQVQFHYDVSDDFYALWLDPRRVYSCAYYRDTAMSLAQAQEAKLDHICRKLQLEAGRTLPGHRRGLGRAADVGGGELRRQRHRHHAVQEPACACAAADRGKAICRAGCAWSCATTAKWARPKGFDKIASVGMFEHVGQANMPAYFGKIHRLLKPGGLVMNHGITSGSIHPGQMGAGMGEFIEKYIFPGGEVLHISHVLKDMALAGLEMVDTENLRPHYARTLWAWSDALEARLDEAQRVLATTGHVDDAQKVLRAYRLYLAGCAMTFEQGWIGLHQILATRPDGQLQTGSLRGAQSAYPFNREYMYRCSSSSSPRQPAT